jgi:hypothetical protein
MAFIINEKRPNVKIKRGQDKIFKIGFKKIFKRAIISAIIT